MRPSPPFRAAPTLMSRPAVPAPAHRCGNNSSDYSKAPEDHTIGVTAVDFGTGERVWTHPRAHPAGATSAGSLTGDLHFVGARGGRSVVAYRLGR